MILFFFVIGGNKRSTAMQHLMRTEPNHDSVVEFAGFESIVLCEEAAHCGESCWFMVEEFNSTNTLSMTLIFIDKLPRSAESI